MDYNPITGEFTADGNTIGCKHSKGYVYLNYTGVHTLPNGNHVAYIKYKGKRKNLGTHKNFNDAVKASRKKEVEYGFTTE